MKAVLRIVITFSALFLLLCGCASSGGYEEGYAAGYDAGYKAALESRAMPEISAAPTPRPTSTPLPTTTPWPSPAPTSAPTQAPDDFTVYVSRSGTMHLKEHCSGMTHSTAMPYSVASQYYSDKCGNCFK